VIITPNIESAIAHAPTVKKVIPDVHVTPCKTDGKDATQELMDYHTETVPIITDLGTVRAVIGRVRTRNHYGIINRSSASAKVTFGEDDSSSSDDKEY
jgi:hypothetical protein